MHNTAYQNWIRPERVGAPSFFISYLDTVLFGHPKRLKTTSIKYVISLRILKIFRYKRRKHTLCSVVDWLTITSLYRSLFDWYSLRDHTEYFNRRISGKPRKLLTFLNVLRVQSLRVFFFSLKTSPKTSKTLWRILNHF